MRPNNPKILVSAALGMVVLVVISVLFTGGKPYSTNLEELRAQFNNDKGKVRLLMLLSPS